MSDATLESSQDAPAVDLADAMVKQGFFTETDAHRARRKAKAMMTTQHQAIIDLGLATEEDTFRTLAELLNLTYWDKQDDQSVRGHLSDVPLKLLFHYRMLPVEVTPDHVTLAFAEPPKSLDLGNIRLVLGKLVRPVIGSPSWINGLLKDAFGIGAGTIQQLHEEKASPSGEMDEVFSVEESSKDLNVDASISDFVDQILMEAMKLKATDVHLEPYAQSVQLRYRVDGIMQSVPVPPDLRRLYSPIVSRLKIMANLDIAERRLPQDGRISMRVREEPYDIRISVIPTKHGESICLRILGRESLFLELSQLGMSDSQEHLIRELVDLPQGLVLVTGPTGSGKTTTLYAALHHANDEGRKIITLEDPVEYQLDGISQIQAREDLGLSFSSGLRSILRHDPDVVLIGEIRDSQTAEIAVRAAHTGHLVLSTLHTNDSVSAITRLLEMGIDPFSLGSALVGSIAQRLALKICRRCLETDELMNEGIKSEMAMALQIPLKEVRSFRGQGCGFCQNKGTQGRVAIYEFFLLNDGIADEILPTTRTGKLRQIAREYGWRSLREEGWAKVQAGIVPAFEVDRLTRRVGIQTSKGQTS